MRPIFSPAPPPPFLPPLRPLLTTCLLLSCAHGHAPSIHACVHKLPKLGIVFSIASLRAHSLFSDHFTHVLPVNCAIFFYSSLYSFLFFFSFLLSINRSPSRTRSRSNRDFAIRSERWKAVTGRPFRLPFTFASPFKDTGRGGSSGVQRCIYTYIYRTKSGRDARTRGR